MNQFIPRTSTTSDPLVATLFALECMFHGHAVVQLIRWNEVASWVQPPNRFEESACFSVIECEFALELKPLDVTSYVAHFIDVDDARQILAAIGFGRVPYQIGSRSALTDDLRLTHDQGLRLNSAERREFDRHAFEIIP